VKDLSDARKQRGEITVEDLEPFRHLTDGELIHLLDDLQPQNRAAAARLLGERRCADAVDALCARLAAEKALYARLAVGEALAAIGLPALPGLISLLGKIGDNQYHAVPDAGFYKKSYPLPRDLAARVLIRMGGAALPMLEEAVRNGERSSTLESVDAIGHIAFNAKNIRSQGVLLDLYRRSSGDTLLRWKLIRAFQSFPSAEVREILEEIIQHDSNPIMRSDALRSLSLHGQGVTEAIQSVIFSDPDPEVQKTAGFFLK
jgi:HEAT repeat protein